MMNVPFVDFRPQVEAIKGEVEEGFKRIFEKGDFILGQKVKEFEDEFSRYSDSKYGIGVNSGTDALFLAVKALGIGPGDEVIVPAFTFIATALGVSFAGATPVFVDIDDKTYNMDPRKLEKAITRKTKAIIVVHLYGQAADMEEILAIAKKHKVKVIEDTAQAHGARYHGKRVGSWGDVSCFSFYPTKGLGTFGDGGMIVTNNEETYQKALMLRDYGRKGRYEHVILGYNSRLDTLQAVVLSAKLKHLDEWNQMRAKQAAYYCDKLGKIDGVVAPVTKENRTHVFQTFAIRVPHRDQVLEEMKSRNIGVLIHYPIPLHLQEAYKTLGYKKGDFPVSEKFAQEELSLPMCPHISTAEIDYVVQSLQDSLKKI